MGDSGGHRERRQPELSVLYRSLQQNPETFLARAEDQESGRDLPRFVVRELRDCLKCGILAHGFCRVHCVRCRRDELVAFSCKRRGFCPSCGARRMADLAAHLVDHVFPEVPVRQWVLSLPHRIRYLCAYDHGSCAVVRRVLARAVSGFYRSRARRLGLPRPQAGAVVFEQRFDSGLRLNLHFHGLWMDGVFARVPGAQGMGFHPHPDLTDEEVALLVRRIQSRVLRALQKRGKLPTDDADAPSDDTEPDLLQDLCAAAVQGRTATGRRRGQLDPRLGRGTDDRPFLKGRLCQDLDGFSLHAAVRIPGGLVDRLEQLCRHAARPPNRARSAHPYGRRHHPLQAQAPLPQRLHARRLQPAHADRTLVRADPAAAQAPRHLPRGARPGGRPARPRRARPGRSQWWRGPRPGTTRLCHPETGPRLAAAATGPPCPSRHRFQRKAYTWAELLRRVFLIDVLTCPHCKGPRRLVAAVFDPRAIENILRCLGLPTDASVVAAARPPPQQRLPW